MENRVGTETLLFLWLLRKQIVDYYYCIVQWTSTSFLLPHHIPFINLCSLFYSLACSYSALGASYYCFRSAIWPPVKIWKQLWDNSDNHEDTALVEQKKTYCKKYPDVGTLVLSEICLKRNVLILGVIFVFQWFSKQSDLKGVDEVASVSHTVLNFIPPKKWLQSKLCALKQLKFALDSEKTLGLVEKVPFSFEGLKVKTSCSCLITKTKGR